MNQIWKCAWQSVVCEYQFLLSQKINSVYNGEDFQLSHVGFWWELLRYEMRQMPELVIFLKLLNSGPCGILGYVTMASDVYRNTFGSARWEQHRVSVSINQKWMHACVECVWRYFHLIHSKTSLCESWQPVCQINCSVQWDRSTQLCRVKERSAAAWSTSFTQQKYRCTETHTHRLTGSSSSAL